MEAKKLKIAVLIANSDFTSLQNDKNLLQIYGESILQITYYKLKPIFDKVLVIVNSFDQQSIYSRQLGEDVLVNLNENKNELTAALTALNACKNIPGAEFVFFAKTNMPLLVKKAIELILGKQTAEQSAIIPQHSNGTIESLHALYKIKPALQAFERAANDEKETVAEALNYLPKISFLPMSEIIKVDPQLQSFFEVESEIDYQRAKEKLSGKIKTRIRKAEKIKTGIERERETETTIYLKVPGSEEEHEVLFNKRAKKWNCDCQHFVMKGTYCSHILAAQNFQG